MSQKIQELLGKQASKINNAIEKYIPREFEKTSTVFTLNPPFYAFALEALNKTISDPIWEFLDRGGKRWRPALFLLVCEALGKNPEDFLDFALIPEVIHNGTLMIDDIEDSSELRRGRPCTYRIFGTDIAINAGNAMYFLPLLSLINKGNELTQSQTNSLYKIFIQEMISLSLGQAMDIAWHRGIADADGVTEESYLQMCAYKTGTLARMAARMAAVVAGASTDLIEKLGRFAEAIGIAFQMQDDILDLSGGEFAGKKGARGMDVTEGKRSLIVIHALENSKPKERKRLIEILNSHTSDQKLRDEAIAIMNNCDSIAYTKKFAKRLVRESWNEVKKQLPSSEAKEKLNAFAIYLIERKI